MTLELIENDAADLPDAALEFLRAKLNQRRRDREFQRSCLEEANAAQQVAATAITNIDTDIASIERAISTLSALRDAARLV